MRVCGLFPVSKKDWCPITVIPVFRDICKAERSFHLIFQAGGPAFLRSAALFPVVKCVEVYACQIDRLTKSQNQTLKIQGGSAPFFRNPTPCRTRWSTVESSSCAGPADIKLPAEFQCVLQGVGFMGILCNTGWERKMPGFDCVIAMVDANVHGFTHPFLLVVDNLRFLLS